MTEPQGESLQIWGFYWKVIRRLPGHFISSADLAFNVIGIITFAILLFNQPLARSITDFDGLSPWFAIIPVVGLTLLALVKQTHELYLDGIQSAATRLDGAQKEILELQGELTRVHSGRPTFVFGEPTEVFNQVLERTHMVPAPGFHSSVSQPPKARVPFENVKVSVWRIPLSNEGGSTDQTYVELTSVDPGIPQGRWPGPLHLAGENPDDHSPESYVRSRGFPLPSGGTAHIDLVAFETAPPNRCFIFAVESDDALCEVALGAGHTFCLTAFGGGVRKSQDYWVRVIAGDSARLTVDRLR